MTDPAMKFNRSTLCWGTIGTLLLATAGASASGISVARFGGEHGHPTTKNATALYYNPAGIALSEGFHVFVDGTVAFRQASYSHSIQPNEPGALGDDGSVPGANDGRADLFNVIASPMIGVTAKFGDFAAGAAFYTPFGGQSAWSKNDKFENDPNLPGPYDGQQRYYNIEGHIRSSFITAGLGYHLKDAGLAFGLTGNIILSSTKTLRAKSVAGSNNLGANNEGRALLETTGTDFSMGAGVLWEAMKEQLWLGMSYQSRPNFTGMNPQTGTQETFLGSETDPVGAEFFTDLPDVYRLGVTYKIDPETELRLFGDYQRWSVLDTHHVINTDLSDQGVDECEANRNPGDPPGQGCLLAQKREWTDTFGVRVGASRWLNKETELFAGAGYSSNAIPDKYLEPALTDFNSVSLSLGGRLEVVENVNVALSYTHLFYLTRDTDGKSDHDLVRPPSSGPNTIENGPDTGGVYKQMIGVVNANVDVQF